MKIKTLLIGIVTTILFSCSVIKDKVGQTNPSFEISNNTLAIKTTDGEFQYSFLTDSSIEVLFTENKKKTFPSFSISPDSKKQTIQVINDEHSFTISAKNSKKLRAVIRKSDLSVEFYRNDKKISQQSGRFNNKKIEHKIYQGFEFQLTNEEKIMGGGERVLGMDRRGHRMPLYNRAHYGYSTQSNQMNYSLPAIMSNKKYTILYDNTASGFLDIGKSKRDKLIFESVGGRQAYIFIAGDNYPELINDYVKVTGKQPLPPRWAFGNFSSRFGYTSQQEVMDTVKLYEEKGFPLDAIIIDLYWFGKDIKGHMGNLDWEKNAFPEPEKMIADLIEKDIKPILITQPFILSSSSRWEEATQKKILANDKNGDPRRFNFYFGNTGLIDVFDHNSKDWFSDIYTGLSQQGIAGVWGDLGEPEVHPDDSIHYLSDYDMTVTGDQIHNAFGHEWGKMVYLNHQKINPQTRPFMLMRSGFAGSQRYGMIPWTGDVDRSWDGLKPQMELSLQMGLFGLAYTHSDLGGFAGGKTFDKEMYIRWLQYGVFQPIYRPHAQAHIPPEPVFHDQETQNIVKGFVELRYRLLPYNYTLAYQNSISGMPLMRPLFFSDENNASLIDEKYNYFWGDAFFISPIIKPDEKKHSVQLPKGNWFDFWNDKNYQGKQTIDWPVTLDKLPVFVKAGSFVPMIDVITNTTKYASEKLTVHYYHHDSIKQSRGEMFEDDGNDPQSIKNQAFDKLIFNYAESSESFHFEFDKQGKGYKGSPKSREIELVIHNWNEELSLAARSELNKNVSKVEFDARKNTLKIHFNWTEGQEKLVIKKKLKISSGKPVIYQVFTRLFGNKNTTNKPWGTIEENGVGKFNDFTDAALKGIKEFGVSHIWFTGVPHHAVIRNYTDYGISNDDPDIVKGRAGSPYAVKDYYNVNPDLAVNPANRLQEFKALIDRTHKNGMKVIIDIVPNHIARNYQSLSKPKGVLDFGDKDDKTVEYKKDNNFYYILGENFKVPKTNNGYQPLNGEAHPLSDQYFKEEPAKWTGNGSRKAQPDINDWYETVKVNYGVRPDGSYDFPRLPLSYAEKSSKEHFKFWKGKAVPDSWQKFKEIVLYWTDLGVDGFRYDMAEMVPVEFWSYLNSSIKEKNPQATLVAEVYNPAIYRDFISLGKMDYLYDKVDFYDTLKAIMQGKQPTSKLLPIIDKFSDIDQHLLHFLENHDEQRIASPAFAGDARLGKPAMVVSTLIGKGPTLLYFGQAMGENADQDAGFGKSSRTTIFDYWGVPSIQRWMNDGKFDAGKLSPTEKSLRDFYVKLLSFSSTSKALNGEVYDLHSYNLINSKGYSEKLFSFARTNENKNLVVVTNFSSQTVDFDLLIPNEVIKKWEPSETSLILNELFTNNKYQLTIEKGIGKINQSIKPLDSIVLNLNF